MTRTVVLVGPEANPVSGNRQVAIFLMKGPEAEATVAVVEADCPELTVHDHVTYFRIEGVGRISIDLDRVAEELGTPVSMGRWLVSLSNFIGRVCSDEDHFIVTAEALRRSEP